MPTKKAKAMTKSVKAPAVKPTVKKDIREEKTLPLIKEQIQAMIRGHRQALYVWNQKVDDTKYPVQSAVHRGALEAYETMLKWL